MNAQPIQNSRPSTYAALKMWLEDLDRRGELGATKMTQHVPSFNRRTESQIRAEVSPALDRQ